MMSDSGEEEQKIGSFIKQSQSEARDDQFPSMSRNVSKQL